jgi:hypothetical protein
LEVLSEHGGNIVWAAEALGVNRVTVMRWIWTLDSVKNAESMSAAIERIRNEWTERRRRPKGYAEVNG